MSRAGGSRRGPWPLDDYRLCVAGPRGHGDAQEPKRGIAGAAVLELGADRDVDGDAVRQGGGLLPGEVATPDLAFARENVPELADGGVDGGAIDLTWRDR